MPGRLRLTVTDTSGHDQLGLIAAVRCRHYDPAATARPIYGAEELYPLDTAALATRAGALGPATNNVIRHTNLASSWTPVLELRKLDTTYLTHTGAYRLLVRAYSPDGSAVKLRVVWDVGDLVNPVENEFDIKQIPGANNFYLLDLGELRLDEVPVGTHRWTGQIQVKGAAGGEDVDLDVVTLLNIDEGYVKCRAPQLPASAFVQSYGPRSGGTFADDASVGTAAWSNPSNAAASDDVRATVVLGAPTGGVPGHYLKATNFGFAIPTGATIAGIKVEIERKSDNLQILDNSVKIVKGGTIQGTEHAVAGTWPLNDAYAAYGGESDTFGVALTVADVNASGFGVALSAKPTNAINTGTASVDHIRITVYYTPPPTFVQDAVLYGNQSAELSWRGHFREDLTGTAYGPISEQIGDLLRMPIAGSENRPVELTVVTSRGDLELLPDTGPDQFTVDGTVEPSHLYPPGS